MRRSGHIFAAIIASGGTATLVSLTGNGTGAIAAKNKYSQALKHTFAANAPKADVKAQIQRQTAKPAARARTFPF